MNRKSSKPLWFIYAMLCISMAISLYLIASSKLSLNFYFPFLSGLIIIGVIWLLGTLKLSDLDIPFSEQLHWLTGEYFGLPRSRYQSSLISFINKYAKHNADKELIRSFLFYASMFYAGLIFGFIASTIAIVSILLWQLPEFYQTQNWQHFYTYLLLIPVLFYAGIVLYRFKFGPASFPNVWLTFRTITRTNILLKSPDVVEAHIIAHPKKESQNSTQNIKSKNWSFDMVFVNAYQDYANSFAQGLRNLEYEKYWWRLCYDEMVKLGLAKSKAKGLNLVDAALCFGAEFDDVNITTFQDNRGESHYKERREIIKSDILMILKSISQFPKEELKRLESAYRDIE